MSMTQNILTDATLKEGDEKFNFRNEKKENFFRKNFL